MSSIIENLDYNSRLAPSLEVSIYQEAPQEYTKKRIVQAVLPLLASVPVLSLRLQIIGGIHSSYNIIEYTKTRPTVENYVFCALNVTSLALLYFNPLAVSITQLTINIYYNTLNCKKNMVNGQYKNALISTAYFAKNVVYIASVVTGGPNLILISMVSQGVFELYNSKQFFNKGMYLEALVQSVMAVSRGSMIVKTHQKEITESFESFKTQFSKLGTISHKSKAADYFADSVKINQDGTYIANYSDWTTVQTAYGRGVGFQFYAKELTSEFDCSNTWMYSQYGSTDKIAFIYPDRKIVTDTFGLTQYIRIY